MRRLLAVLVIVPALMVASAVPASAATPTARIDSAVLVAKGAGVSLTATVTCDAGANGSVNVNLTQRSGRGMAGANWSQPFQCSGAEQTISGVATAHSTPLRVGDALARTLVYSCDYYFCTYSEQTTVIRITAR